MATAPPRPLTRAQWLATSAANRGGWTYTKYLRWWNGRTRKQAPPAKQPMFNPLAPLSPAALETQAQREAEQSLAPTRAELERQRAANEALYANRAKNIQGFGLAGADLLKPIAGQIQAGYAGAAGETAAFAKGYADAGTQIAQTNAQGGTDLLKTVAPNAPAEQGAAITSAAGAGALPGGPPGAALHDVTYAQGEIPAAGLAREGAAFGASASMLPGALLGQTQATMQQTTAEGAAKSADITGQLTQLEGTRPDIVNKILDSLRSNELQKIATSINQQYLGVKKQQVKVDAKTTALKAGLDASEVDETLSASNGYLTNKYGQPILQNGQQVPYKKYVKPSTAAGPGSKRNKDFQTKREKMFNDAKAMTVTSKGTNFRDPATYGKTITKPKYTYAQAKQILWNKYGASLMGYATPKNKTALRNQVNTMINNALAQIGLHPPRPPRSAPRTTPGRRPGGRPG